MFTKRVASVCVSAVLAVGGGAAAGILTASSAGAGSAIVVKPALGVTHHQTAMVKSSAAVEGSARFSFSCNDVTGKYTVMFTNVQVIDADHVSLWPTFNMMWAIDSSAADHHDSDHLDLVQNATSGLFAAQHSGTLTDVGACVTGAILDANVTDHAGLLAWTGTLT
jgi:hypothetical protein